MVREIRIYVEGGGADNPSRTRMRAGFARFLDSIHQLARQQGGRLRVIPCGSRPSACKDFQTALKSHPEALNILLVDSDSAVTGPVLAHLPAQDRWDCEGISEDQAHLMVQTVESWLIADPETLAEFYGKDFRASALPKREDVEAIEKKTVLSSLERATERTSKGKYHKTRHTPDLLERIRPEVVRRRAKHCDRLFANLEELVRRRS